MEKEIKKTKDEINFEKELKRLDDISEKLSSSNTSIDDAMKLYEEGNDIIDKLEEAIENAKLKIENLIKDSDDLSRKIEEGDKEVENSGISK